MKFYQNERYKSLKNLPILELLVNIPPRCPPLWRCRSLSMQAKPGSSCCAANPPHLMNLVTVSVVVCAEWSLPVCPFSAMVVGLLPATRLRLVLHPPPHAFRSLPVVVVHVSGVAAASMGIVPGIVLTTSCLIRAEEAPLILLVPLLQKCREHQQPFVDLNYLNFN